MIGTRAVRPGGLNRGFIVSQFREAVKLLRSEPANNLNQLPEVAIYWPILLSPAASPGAAKFAETYIARYRAGRYP